MEDSALGLVQIPLMNLCEQSLERIAVALEKIAEIDRLAYEMQIDTTASTAQLTGSLGEFFNKIGGIEDE